MTDDGTVFSATITTRAGESLELETADRVELLTWIDAQQREGSRLTAVGMVATGRPAIANFLAALTFGLARMRADRGARPS